ncbi:MAG: decarboxylating 6-phosphogluconate dehydrogenase [Promethearchaeota archaeon]
MGIVGLGKMGGSIALHCLDGGIRPVGKDRTEKPELERRGVKVVTDYGQFANLLTPPRRIFLSLPAGDVVDRVIMELVPFLDAGDVLVDGGNSFWMDSVRRHKSLAERGILFCDCGTSGGVEGARNGACFMVGGTPEAVALVEPILKRLAVEGGYLHAGEPGSGHFVKLVHNGIEFGMLQAIGEGFALLRNSEFDLDLPAIFRNWSHGSVIRSWLVELMERGLREQGGIENVPSYVEDTGEVNWLVQYAINREVPVPVTALAVMELFRSRQPESDAHRAIALMRHGFGGHPFGPDEYIRGERSKSRLSKL